MPRVNFFNAKYEGLNKKEQVKFSQVKIFSGSGR